MAAPVRLGYGEAEHGGFTLILRDITREKSLEEERDEFISVVSHELRTPIAIAEGNISNAQFVIKNAKSANRAELVDKSMDEAHSQVLFLAGLTICRRYPEPNAANWKSKPKQSTSATFWMNYSIIIGPTQTPKA